MVETLVSVVSNRHGPLVAELLSDFERHCTEESIEVVLTLNITESLALNATDFSFPLRIVRNSQPKGFAANHNAAFRPQGCTFFCVLNPDVRLRANPFPALRQTLADAKVAVAAPLVVDSEGRMQDNARRWPSPLKIAQRVVGFGRGAEYAIGGTPLSPDCVAGVFMLMRAAVYAELNGFDQRYFLYFEDIDLCARARLCGYDIVLNPAAVVIHAGQRQGRRNLKHFQWHFASMTRFFCSRVYLATLRQRAAGRQES